MVILGQNVKRRQTHNTKHIRINTMTNTLRSTDLDSTWLNLLCSIRWIDKGCEKAFIGGKSGNDSVCSMGSRKPWYTGKCYDDMTPVLPPPLLP